MATNNFKKRLGYSLILPDGLSVMS